MGVFSFCQWIFLLFSIFLSILIVRPVYAIKTGMIRKKDVVFLFERPLRQAAEETIALYPEVKDQLERRIGWGVHFTPTIFLVNNGMAFQKMASILVVLREKVCKKQLYPLKQT